MRARPARAQIAAPAEWLIVARWGQGELLSVSWTGADAAAGDAPLDLTPKRTVIGVRDRSEDTGCSSLFRLLAIPPDDLFVTGLFAPATGTARLSGCNAALRLRTEGHALGSGIARAWDLDAGRSAWIGEFVQSAIVWR